MTDNLTEPFGNAYGMDFTDLGQDVGRVHSMKLMDSAKRYRYRSALGI
jgi:hypothetical protein